MEWAAREALSWTDNILSGGEGGGTPLVSHIGMYPPPPQMYPFWSGVGYGFRATTEVYEGIYRFNSK